MTAALKRFGLMVLETAKVIIISLAIILPIRYFLVQPFIVEGASMEPNFESNEYLIIDELSYRFNQPQRGEVIVFRYEKDPSQFFIKRVIGLPGEAVEIEDGKVLINDQPLAENYLDAHLNSRSHFDRIVLKAGQYFLMGDNRGNSLDSRVFGPVDSEFIVGRVWFRTWPFDRFSFFSPPQY